MTTIPLYQVDAFSSVPFEGNPAAVCLLENDISSETKQKIALENNLSETAFVVPLGDNHFNLKWFTLAAEIELCGHATLASAHILWQTGTVAKGQKIFFETLSGTLIISQEKDWIVMDFPAVPATDEAIHKPLREYFGNEAREIVHTAGGKYIVLLKDETTVRNFQPDFQALKDYMTLITAAGADTYDFVSRFFALPVGVPEDPVTGSAHCALAPFWAKKLGKNSFLAYQASARGGEMKVMLEGDRVLLSGHAVTVLKGEMYL